MLMHIIFFFRINHLFFQKITSFYRENIIFSLGKHHLFPRKTPSFREENMMFFPLKESSGRP